MVLAIALPWRQYGVAISTSLITKEETTMQNRKTLSRLFSASLLSLAFSVQAAELATLPRGPGSATDAASVYVDDAMITTKVKAALIEDKQVQSLKISVSTEKGVVKLSGSVPNADVGKHVLQLAAKVQGVRDVKS